MKKTVIATALTIAWLAIGVLLIALNFESARSMPLNEIGDFLAGLFSPVAFLWLVVGYFQQGEELKLNTRALELQVNELKLSVEQQRELVEVTRADMAITKMAYELETEREIRKSQPLLQLSANSYSSSSGKIVALEALLMNDGYPCTSVTLSCREGTLSQTEHPLLPNNAKKLIKYNFYHPVHSFETQVSYLDGLGIKRYMVIEAIQNESGSLFFLPAKEVSPENA